MKSLMEEASSIFKAIETAWNRAGKPQEFSIKILEHPEKSFFGLNTVKSAKIALLFNEYAHKQTSKPQQSARPSNAESTDKEHTYARKPHQQRHRDEQATSTHEPREHRRPERTQEQRFEQRTETRSENQNTAPSEGRYENRRRDGYERRDNRRDGRRDGRRDFRNDRRSDRQQDYGDPNATWSPEMIQAATEWLRETLVMVGQPENTFSTNTNKNYLNITFISPISTDTVQEELLLKSWGSLLMDAVRQKFDGTTRGLRVGLHRK